MLEQVEHEVKILDASLENKDTNEIIRIINKFQPDIVGINILTPYYHYAKSLIQEIKANVPKIITIAGGPHVTVLPVDTLMDTGVDYVVIGEGEISITKLVKKLEMGESPDDTRGLGFIKNGKVKINPKRELIKHLDSIPFPARHLLKIKKYNKATIVKQKPYTTILSSRGCPFNCIFCCNVVLWGGRYRQRSVENVIQEILNVYDKFGIREIYFPDDNFTANRKWIEMFCDEILKTKIDFTWRCLSRVDTIDHGILQKMKKAGCHTLEFGVESGDEYILKVINKQIKISQVIKAFAAAKKVGLNTRAYFMIGNIGETIDTIKKTIALAQKLNPDHISFLIATPLPGTNFYIEAKKKDLIVDDDWQNYDYTKKAVSRTEALTADELLYWQDIANIMFYSRKRYVTENILAKLNLSSLTNRYDLMNILNKFRYYSVNLLKRMLNIYGMV